MIRGRRLAVATMAGVLAVGGAAGCGSSDSDSGGGTANVDVLEQAASRTAAAKSFHMVTSTQQSVMGTSFTVRAEGDYAGSRGKLTLDFADLTKLLGAAPGADALLDQVGGVSALKATMITDKKTILIKMPALQKGLKTFANRTVPAWASIDVQKLGSTIGIDLGSLFAGSAGADQTIAYIKALTGSLKTIGKEQIDGEQTTHYRGTLDFAKLPEGTIPPQMRKTMQQLAQTLKAQGASTKVPVDVWVGEDGLIRRQVIVQKIQGSTSRTTVDFSDYGKPVDVTLPPAAERFDALALIDELAPGALKQAGAALSGVIR